MSFHFHNGWLLHEGPQESMNPRKHLPSSLPPTLAHLRSALDDCRGYSKDLSGKSLVLHSLEKQAEDPRACARSGSIRGDWKGCGTDSCSPCLLVLLFLNFKTACHGYAPQIRWLRYVEKRQEDASTDSSQSSTQEHHFPGRSQSWTFFSTQ